jgi:isopenicillin-N epimerase
MMRLNIHEIGCDMYTSSPHKWLFAPKGSGFLFVREEVMDRLWNTIVTAGWDEPNLKGERFQRIGSSNVPALWGMRAAVELAKRIGMERIEKRHRENVNYILSEMTKRGALSWTSPNAGLRCAIATVNIAPQTMPDTEKWMWKEKKIRIRGGAPSKIRLSTPYYLLRKDADRFLAAYDEYRGGHKV